MFDAERPNLVPYAGRFDGFHAVPASVSKTCLVRFDNNKYSVAAGAVGRPVEIRAYADRIELRQDGRIVGEHQRCSGRDRTIYDPWHYVPVLVNRAGFPYQRALVSQLSHKFELVPTNQRRRFAPRPLPSAIHLFRSVSRRFPRGENV